MAFLRYKTTGYSSALAYAGDPWSVLFVRGGRAAAVTASGAEFTGKLTEAFGGTLANLPWAYAEASDGALMLPDDGATRQSLFFWQNQAARYNWDTGVCTELRWHEIGNWGTALPIEYRANLDVLHPAPSGPNGTWRTYFFKGARVLTLDWTSGVVRECLATDGPDASGAVGWSRLPAEFRTDFDHVIALVPAADGVRRSLLVKGADGCILNWDTGVEQTGEVTALAPGLDALPGDFATQYRPLSGRYVAEGTFGRVELRIDLDGDHPLGVVSGDIFTVSGGTRVYNNSFRAPAPTVAITESRAAVAMSDIQYANPASWTELHISLPRTAVDQPAANAELTLGTPTWESGSRWPCALESPLFRTVDLETDTMVATTAFREYDTSKAATPPGYRNRVMTVASAYAEAGIDVRTAGVTNVASDSSGRDLRWSESELHAAMVANFSLQRDVPQWKLWAFVATRHVVDRVAGIMFDTIGSPRQGMAVFHQVIKEFNFVGTNVELHTYVHEIGHAFNLAHAWQKQLGNPPAPLGPLDGFGDLSWMNYPQNYRSPAGNGSAAFWGAFPFRFSDNELMHLRHGFHRHVIPGGDQFLVNSALGLDGAEAFALPVADESGLRFELTGKTAFEYGEPVMAEVRLSCTGTRGDVTVTADLSPKSERVAFAVTDPQGRSRVFRPIARLCSGHGAAEPTVTLTQAEPAVYDTAFLGYGSDGLYFSDPGLYKITAVYHAPDGSRVVSPPRAVRVRHPVARADQEAGELMMGDEQGTLLALLGSDAPQLARGNDALAEVVEKYGNHPLATYARLARGANAGRHFQHLREGRIEVRQPDIKSAVTQLSAAIEASKGDAGLDNLTLNAAMRRLATVHAKEGDVAQANVVLDRMATHFRSKHVPRQVQRHIEQQADETKAAIREMTT